MSSSIDDGFAVDRVAAMAAVDRLAQIRWAPEPARSASQIASFKEFLRRSAVIAHREGRTANWPWDDYAANAPGIDSTSLPAYVFLGDASRFTDPAVDLVEDRIVALNVHLNRVGLRAGPWGRQACWWYIRWQAVKHLPVIAGLGAEDPYEPLIVFFERGGSVRPEQGYFDLEHGNVTNAGWRHALKSPANSLNREMLDRLDS